VWRRLLADSLDDLLNGVKAGTTKVQASLIQLLSDLYDVLQTQRDLMHSASSWRVAACNRAHLRLNWHLAKINSKHGRLSKIAGRSGCPTLFLAAVGAIETLQLD
jgi:hypothetical protein